MRSRVLLIAVSLAGSAGMFGACTGNADLGVEGPQRRPEVHQEKPELGCAVPTRSAAVPAQRLTFVQYRNSIEDVFEGQVTPSAQYPQAVGKSGTGFSSDASLVALDEVAIESVMLAAEEVAEKVAPQLPALLPCSTRPEPDESCAEAFIDTFGSRAFRRPLTSADREPLLEVFRAMRASGGDFAAGIAAITATLLQSPQFLDLFEVGVPTSEGRRLTSHEVATRLSYFLWDRPPDAQLLAEAAAGRLQTAEQVSAQAARMIDDDRARPAIARFFREWLHFTDARPETKETSLYPAFDAELADAYREEFDLFIHAAIKEGWTLPELLTSATTFVNPRLATFYGLPAPQAGGWTRVTLPSDRHRGLLGRPAVMAGLAHRTHASYVMRGHFIRSRLLCQELGSPPANAVEAFNMLPLPPHPTAKEVSASVRARSECVGCHTIIDPAGLALEQYDAFGRFLERDDQDRVIDVTGELVGVPETGNIRITSAHQMFVDLSKVPAINQCLAVQWVRHALARREVESDACLVDTLRDHLAARNLRDMLIGLAQSEALRVRPL